MGTRHFQQTIAVESVLGLGIFFTFGLVVRTGRRNNERSAKGPALTAAADPLRHKTPLFDFLPGDNLFVFVREIEVRRIGTSHVRLVRHLRFPGSWFVGVELRGGFTCGNDFHVPSLACRHPGSVGVAAHQFTRRRSIGHKDHAFGYLRRLAREFGFAKFGTDHHRVAVGNSKRRHVIGMNGECRDDFLILFPIFAHIHIDALLGRAHRVKLKSFGRHGFVGNAGKINQNFRRGAMRSQWRLASKGLELDAEPGAAVFSSKRVIAMSGRGELAFGITLELMKVEMMRTKFSAVVASGDTHHAWR